MFNGYPSDDASPTTVTISWSTAAVDNSEYDEVNLCDVNGNLLKNMLTQSSYTYTASALIITHFKIICHSSTNNPPNIPSKPSGQTNGKIGQEYSYTTSTTDPDGDQVYYNWSWGDGTYSGWIGLYDSGEMVNESYSWAKKGNYDIKVKAKDIFGMESDWSDPLAIRMPKMYIYNPIVQLLFRIFERFPLFEKILNLYCN